MTTVSAIWKRVLRKRKLSILIGVAVGVFVVVAGIYLQNDIHRNLLDPKTPFQIYQRPEAPDYEQMPSWYLNPALSGYTPDARKVDVFFVHGTSYNGGKHWLGPIDQPQAVAGVREVQLPNYAKPFAIMGSLYVPRYRQASLYTQLTMREDARDARAFAYRDIDAAFDAFLKGRSGGRGFVIVGLEQGGLLAQRLLITRIAASPELKSQLVAAYLIETPVPDSVFNSASFLPCAARTDIGCVVAYLSVDAARPDKALRRGHKAVLWEPHDTLSAIGGRPLLCVNPITGTMDTHRTEFRLALGATNATGLEWDDQPALIPRKVSAQCLNGILLVEKPTSPSFSDEGSWVDQRKLRPYNLFYGDIAADMEMRWQIFRAMR